jgi:D-3-phosphoglycerate dehydrogenase / 2-oxoglutarate reductase
MIRILNAEPLDYNVEARRILQSIGAVEECALSRNELIERISDYQILVVRLGFTIDKTIIDAAPNLRVIATPTTGLDHIDIEYAKFKGIAVLSLKGETAFLTSIPATAEHTWALLLALIRRIPSAFSSICRAESNRDAFRGNELYEKRLGILGLGRIGEKIARFGLAFGMEVHAYDPFKADWLPGVTRADRLTGLLHQSQILTVHVPLSSETYHLIGKAELENLPPGAILINTSRGAVINERDLLEQLQNKHLGGSALDVLEGEVEKKPLSTNPLIEYARSHDNLILTPHIGGATFESMARTEIFIANKILQYTRNNVERQK